MRLLYWVFKLLLVRPGLRLLMRPWIEGEENIPTSGPAVLVSNHLSAGDTFLLPALMKRRLTFPAKAELFEGTGFKGRFVTWFLTSVGMHPMDRSGGRASAHSMDSVLGVLRDGHLLGIFPEGTRSVDGRLYKGKTGVARLVLAAGVPVVPVAMVNTQFVRTGPLRIPLMRRPGIRIGKPMDFTRYSASGNDRDVLRWVTDEIMNAVMVMSGQEYVDAYGASVKSAREDGREIKAPVLARPGAGRAIPPVPAPAAAEPAVAGPGAPTEPLDPALLPPTTELTA